MNTVTFKTDLLMQSYIQRTITKYADGKRKITGSTNLLMFFGWNKDTPVEEIVIGKGKGIKIVKCEKQVARKRIYQRQYKRRSNNPCETYFEISAQSKVDTAIPLDCERVNIKITHDAIYVTPDLDASVRAKNASVAKRFIFDAICTGGVDAHAFANAGGWEPRMITTYRPVEARDGSQDKTETNVLSAIANVPFKTIVNKDIYTINYHAISEVFKTQPHCLVGSLECDDYSAVKEASKKQAHLESGKSTLDMWIAMLDNIKAYRDCKPMTVLLENVSSFIYKGIHRYHTTDAKLSYIRENPSDYTESFKLFKLQLQRMGYTVHHYSCNALSYGSNSSRFRSYIFATLLDSKFHFPEPTGFSNVNVWKDIVLPELEAGNLKPMKSSKSFAKENRRAISNIVDENFMGHTGCLIRSQSRQVTESIYIQHNGETYMPNNTILKALLSIDMGFDVEFLPVNEAQGIIGQSVFYSLYKRLAARIRQHICDALAYLKQDGR